jgi:hypothetical protein
MYINNEQCSGTQIMLFLNIYIVYNKDIKIVISKAMQTLHLLLFIHIHNVCTLYEEMSTI